MAYLNRALTNFRAEINQRWPNRDKASDGWIGDAAHQSRPSDHNPDPDGSVDAIDIDVDGIDVNAVINAAIKHEATHYVIYNRRITSTTMAGGLGTWHTYYGPDPHTGHIHVSSLDAYENSNKPWFPTEVKKMTDTEKLHAVFTAIFLGGSSCGKPVPAEYRVAGDKSAGNAIVDKLNYITALLEKAAAK